MDMQGYVGDHDCVCVCVYATMHTMYVCVCMCVCFLLGDMYINLMDMQGDC